MEHMLCLIGKIRGHECIAVEQAAVLPELLSLRLGECLSNAAGAGQGKVHEYRRDDGAEDTLGCGKGGVEKCFHGAA